MKPNVLILLACALLPVSLQGQERFATRTGHISFHSDTPLEKIEADNHKVTCVLDATTSAIQFAVLIKAFEFEKALMQEHFNENYMESSTYPKAEFKGKVEGLAPGQLARPGAHEVEVKGDLTIHGVTKSVAHMGTITVAADGTIKAVSDFVVKPEDHDIKVPAVVRKNIAEAITVKVRLDLVKM